MAQFRIDYFRLLDVMPSGVSYSDLADTMGRSTETVRQLFYRVQQGRPVSDLYVRDLAKALSELRGSQVSTRDLALLTIEDENKSARRASDQDTPPGS